MTGSDSQSSPFSDIVRSIRDRVVAVTALDPVYVRVVASDNYRIACVEDKFAFIRYYGLTPETDSGVGRRARRAHRFIRCYLYTRSSLDQYGDDAIALLDDGGQSDFEEQVLDSLDEYMPVNDDGEAICVEVLHPLPDSEGPPERAPENDDGLIRSSLLFECLYVPPKSNPAL